MSTQALTVQGKPVEFATLPNIRQYLASKAGITLPTVAKGDKGPTTKDVVALCKAAGRTDEQIKADRKELDGVREKHYVSSKMVAAMLSADPSLRASVKAAKNKDGVTIGANVTFRAERSASMSLKTENAQLKARLAALEARFAAPALPA